MAAEGTVGFKNKIIPDRVRERLRSKILAEEQSLLSKLGKVSGSVR